MLSPEQAAGWRVRFQTMPKLKVFRTPIGFHDAYVAAPSRKAALKAWGADANLFARGAAEQVMDEALMREPLSRPGEVVKRPRGSADEHLAASTPPRLTNKAPPAAGGKATPRTKAPPRPSRATLTAAEEALDDHRRNTDAEIARLEAERADIVRRIAAARKSADSDARKLEEQRDKARAAYEKALNKWRDG